MKPSANQRTASMRKLTFLLVLFSLIIDGCSPDPNPTGPSDLRYPSIAGHWVGSASVSFNSGRSDSYAIDANFTQKADSILGGNWLWTHSGGQKTRSYFTGTITELGYITIAETSFVAENWSGVNWEMFTYKASLSADGNTISSNKQPFSFPGGGGGTVSLLLTRAR